MAFRITGVKSNSISVDFDIKRSKWRNQISIVVGPNGVGKTRLLTALANKFRGRKGSGGLKDAVIDFNVDVAAESLAGPSRVVAQTFSPFSRFPADRRQLLRFKEYLNDEQEKYVAIGFTRAMGIRGSVSKDAVGRIVRKLVTRPDQAKPLGAALSGLGFHQRLELWYASTPGSRRLDLSARNLSRDQWRKEVSQFLGSIESQDRVYSEQLRVKRELSDKDEVRDTTIREIEESLHVVLSLESKLGRISAASTRPQFKVDLPLEGKLSAKTGKLLKAIVTLNRFGILRLQDCNFFPDGSRREWSKNSETAWNVTGSAFDITDASSGEQQLLSSLFGLVAEAEDDSLILMDEPELSLHPSWQTQFLDLLLEAIKGFKGCHVIIATHSALVAQRARELKLDIVSLGGSWLPNEGGLASRPSVDQTLLETFGLAVRDSAYVSRLLLSIVLDAETSPVRSEAARVKLQTLKVIYDSAAVKDEHVSELIDDALELIGPQ